MKISFQPGSEAPHFSYEELFQMREMIRADVPGFEFEPAYVSFIEMQNGGRPLERFLVNAGNKIYDVDEFLHYGDTSLINDRELRFLNANVAWSAIEDRLGAGLVPFAISSGGDFFCFDVRPGGEGHVVLWMHEGREGKVVEITRSFDEFLSRLSRKFVPN